MKNLIQIIFGPIGRWLLEQNISPYWIGLLFWLMIKVIFVIKFYKSAKRNSLKNPIKYALKENFIWEGLIITIIIIGMTIISQIGL